MDDTATDTAGAAGKTTVVSRADAPFALGAGLVAMVLATFVFVLFPAEPAVLALGVVLGSLSALVAVGLVLVWRANRIVNFAQGDLGGLAAVLAASLIVSEDGSFLPAVLVGLVAAVGLGWAVEAVGVATLGVGWLFGVSSASLGAG